MNVPSVKKALLKSLLSLDMREAKGHKPTKKSHSHKVKATGSFDPCAPQDQPSRDPHLGAGDCQPLSL